MLKYVAKCLVVNIPKKLFSSALSQANCILTLELDVELLESGSRAARCIERLIFHKTGQLGGWPGCLPSLTK